MQPDRSRPAEHPSEPRTLLAGITVREDDVEPAAALHLAGVIFRVAAVVILLLAGWQAFEWFRDPPPGGVGLSVIIGDTIRLVVVSVLLYGAADLADLFVKNFEENRATRILLARQTFLMKQLAVAGGDIHPLETTVDRRGLEPEDVVALTAE